MVDDNLPRRQRGTDPTLESYLEAVDLEGLDLSAIALDRPPAHSPAVFIGAATVLLASIVCLLWLPQTALYQLHAAGEVVFWSAVAVALGALRVALRHFPAVRTLLRTQAMGAVDQSSARSGRSGLAADALGATGQALTAATTTAGRLLTALAPQMAQFAVHVRHYRRAYMLVAIAAAVGAVAFVLPREAEWANGTYSTSWFVAAAVAMICGILVGRFILAQAEASPLPKDLQPWRLPSWLRWVNLAALVSLALVVQFGDQWFGWGGPGSNGGFGRSGLGLAVGILGAIWLARRFDEWEQGFRQAAARPPVPPSPPPPLAPPPAPAGEVSPLAIEAYAARPGTGEWDLRAVDETSQIGEKH